MQSLHVGGIVPEEPVFRVPEVGDGAEFWAGEFGKGVEVDVEDASRYGVQRGLGKKTHFLRFYVFWEARLGKERHLLRRRIGGDMCFCWLSLGSLRASSIVVMATSW